MRRSGGVSAPAKSALPYCLVITIVPNGTCGHSSRTSLLYIRMQPWLAIVPMTQGLVRAMDAIRRVEVPFVVVILYVLAPLPTVTLPKLTTCPGTQATLVMNVPLTGRVMLEVQAPAYTRTSTGLAT